MAARLMSVAQSAGKFRRWLVQTAALAAAGLFGGAVVQDAEAERGDLDFVSSAGMYADEDVDERCPIYPCCDPAVCYP